MLKKSIPLALVLVALFISGCSLKEATSLASAATDEFFVQYNDADYSAIYDGAHDDYKDEITRSQFVRFCEDLKADVGDMRSKKRINWNASSSSPGGTRANGTYDVSFEKGKLSISLSWKIEDGEALLLGWSVSASPGGDGGGDPVVRLVVD